MNGYCNECRFRCLTSEGIALSRFFAFLFPILSYISHSLTRPDTFAIGTRRTRSGRLNRCCQSRSGFSSSDLLGLAPGSDNNCDNYTVRPIITCRHDAALTDGPSNNKRPPSHFHEMSHRIMVEYDGSRKESTACNIVRRCDVTMQPRGDKRCEVPPLSIFARVPIR